ncbi:MAG: hypothetical protein LC659_03675 [Myxococcales bacterium]|nr:hypothetical protein [Myxococcales bacterium]
MIARLVAGFLQAATGVAVGVWWRGRHPVDAPGDIAAQLVHGFSHYVYFLLLTPWGWLAVWLFVEGILRVLAAAMQQPFGSAPLSLARWAWAARPRRKLRDDVVMKSGDGWVIDSARDYDWHALTTVDIGGALYQVAREPGTREYPHRYRLTPIAHDHVARSVTRYPSRSERNMR